MSWKEKKGWEQYLAGERPQIWNYFSFSDYFLFSPKQTPGNKFPFHLRVERSTPPPSEPSPSGIKYGRNLKKETAMRGKSKVLRSLPPPTDVWSALFIWQRPQLAWKQQPKCPWASKMQRPRTAQFSFHFLSTSPGLIDQNIFLSG